MVHKRNLKKIKLNKILKRLLSVTLIFLINFSYILPPISYSYAQAATPPNELQVIGSNEFLVREYGPEQIVEFEYDTLDNFSPLSSEYVSKVRRELISGGSGSGSARTAEYDAVTVVGRVVSNIQLPTEDRMLKPNLGLEGYIVLAFEHIEFGETAYFNWSHVTTTNKNGSFAIPIDKRTPGAFVVILKPVDDGFRLINSYDISSQIEESAYRRTTDGIITLGEIEIGEGLYIEDTKDWLEYLPEFVSIYSKDYENVDDNYYTCGANSDIRFDKYERDFEVPVTLEDEPFTYDIQGGVNRGKFENKENTFEILDVDGKSSNDKYRSIECIGRLAEYVYNIESLGDDQYFEVIENDGDGNECFEYNEQFLPLTDKYLYTNFKLKQGLLSVHYLKSNSGATNFYSGPANYINPFQSNKDNLLSCDEFKIANGFQSTISTENRRTYAGLSNLVIPQTTTTKIKKGVLDFAKVYNTQACIEESEIKTYGQLINEGTEIPEKFLLNLYLGNNGNTRVTDLSTIGGSDNIQNENIQTKYGSQRLESGRSEFFEKGKEPDKASAIWSKISDTELDNRNIYGNATAAIDNSSPASLPKNGFYHTVLPYYSKNNNDSIYIYEIGPQRSLCEQVYTNDPDVKDVNLDPHNQLFIENETVDLYPTDNQEAAYTGWLLDNKNITNNDNAPIEDPTTSNNWLFSNFFGNSLDTVGVQFNKLKTDYYLTFNHYLKQIKTEDDQSASGRKTIQNLIKSAHDDNCLERNFINIKDTSFGTGGSNIGNILQKMSQIDSYCEGSCENILWQIGKRGSTDCEVVADESDDCVFVPGAYSLGSSSTSSSSSSGAPSLNANSQEVVDKFRSADPLVVRINNVNVNTTVEDAINVANQVVALGLPEETIVVYGNELNNLEVEWKTVPEPEGPADASLIRQAANGYAVIFKVFAEIVKSAGLRVSPGPPDLYNGIFSGAVWAEQARSQGVYDTANALVANAYEIPEIKGIQATIDELEELTGKQVDFLTEIGPHPRLSVQEHVEFLNSLQQQQQQPTNGGGVPLKAATLIPNNCGYESSEGTPDSWLFYIRGVVYGMNGSPTDCSVISDSPSAGSIFIGPHEAGLNPDIGDMISGLPVVIMLGNEYSSGGGGGGGPLDPGSLNAGWQEIKIATELKYTCEAEKEDNLKIQVKDYKKELDYLGEVRSLNQNSIMVRDIFSLPNTPNNKKPYTIGKKRVELYSFLENETEYDSKDIPKDQGPFAALIAGIGSFFGFNQNPNLTEDLEANVLTHVRLISDVEDNSVNKDIDSKNIEPAGANLDWLRVTTKLPVPVEPLPYNKVIYRDINIEKRLEGRFVVTAGENIYAGDGDPTNPTLPRIPASGQLSCPVQCNPTISCFSLNVETDYCRHGSDEYWQNIGEYCKWPIPAYNFFSGIRLPYAPPDRRPNVFCGSSYKTKMDAGIVNADKYGSATDLESTCEGNRDVFAPSKKDISEWKVISANKEKLNNSYVVLEGIAAEGVIRLYLHHLDAVTMPNNIVTGATIPANEKIGSYNEDTSHVHVEMVIDQEIVIPDLYLESCTDENLIVTGPSEEADYYLTADQAETTLIEDPTEIPNLNQLFTESENRSSNISISLRNLGISSAANWVKNTIKAYKGLPVDDLINRRIGSLCGTPFYRPNSSASTLEVGVGCKENETDANNINTTLWEEEYVQAYCYDMLSSIYSINRNFVTDLGGSTANKELNDFAKLFFDGNGRSFCELIQGYAMTVDNSGVERYRDIGFSYDITIMGNNYGNNIIGAMTSLRNNISSRISGIPDNNYDFFKQLVSSGSLQRMNRDFKNACSGTSIMEIIGLKRGLRNIVNNEKSCNSSIF